MPKSENQKLKIFYIAEYLKENTDEEHAVYAKDLRAFLGTKGISSEEHSIGRDIALLRDEFGMDILGGQGKPFYLASREFEPEELSAISISVASSKFLTKKKASEINKKVLSMASKHESEKIYNKAFEVDRVRSENEAIFYSFNNISEAILKDHKISFSYITHSLSEANRIAEKDRKFTVSPWELFFNEGVYYLFAYLNKNIYTFRVDRMKNVSPITEKREGQEEFRQYNLKTYPKMAFNMFGRKERDFTAIEIIFDNEFLDTMIDRFGKSGARYQREDEKHFKLIANVFLSRMFYAWLCQFGEKAKLVNPPNAVSDFKAYLMEINSQYT